jgi:hypothetical protein
MIYVFGDHELDTALRTPRRRGASKLEPRVFNVLAYLSSARRRYTRGTWTISGRAS